MSMITDDIISAEMLVHVPMCTHKDPKKVLILAKNKEIEIQLQKYQNLTCTFVFKNFLKEVETLEEASYDVVIADIEENMNVLFIAQLNRVLAKDGLFVCTSEDKKALMLDCGNLFGIVMPYRYTKTKTFDEVVLSSKRYHPTADIILQRSDLLEDMKYYNTEIHLASFALPSFEKKNLAGIYKQ